MATGWAFIDTGSTIPLATNTISEDAKTKHIGRSILNDSSGNELGNAAAPLQVNLAVIGSGTLATINTVKTVSVVANIASVGAVVTVAGSLNTVSTVSAVASVTSVNTVGVVANIASVGTVVTVANINTVNTVGTVANIASVGANVTVTGSINTVSTVSFVASANIGSVGSVTTLATINTVNTLMQFAKSIHNKSINYSAAAETTLVAAVAGKVIKVFAYSVISNNTAGNVIDFKDAASGNIVWSIPINAVYGANLVAPIPTYLFASNGTNTPIAIAFSSANSANVSVSYWDDDAF